jgi:multidrug transporter EmrE-like cation transporter
MSKLPFSVAYPLQSISYIGGLIASVYILKEQVVTMQWLGAIVILVGVIMIASKG